MEYQSFRKIMLRWGISSFALPKTPGWNGTHYVRIRDVPWLAKASKKYANVFMKFDIAWVKATTPTGYQKTITDAINIQIFGINPERITGHNFVGFVNSVAVGYCASLPRMPIHSTYGSNSWYLRKYEIFSEQDCDMLKGIKTDYLRVAAVISNPEIIAARKARKAAYALARQAAKEQTELAQKAAAKAMEQFDIVNC